MSDHPEMIEQIKKMFDEKRDAADKAAIDDKEPFIPLDQVDEFASKVIDVHDISVKRHKAVRAVGFLEGFGALLWTQVGPNLSDEEVVEFEKRVADIAAYIGLPPREGSAE
jgi:hypothetical protein